MYFYYEQDIPPNTPDSSPVTLRPKIAQGFLEFVDVGIPRRVQRLAKCKIYYNEFQLVPFNRDMWLTGEDITLRVPINIMLDEEPYELKIICYNLDDTYLHQLSFGISVDIGKKASISDLAALSTLVQVQGDNT